MVMEVRPASAQGLGGLGCGSDSKEQGNTFGVILEVVEVTNGGNIAIHFLQTQLLPCGFLTNVCLPRVSYRHHLVGKSGRDGVFG